MTDDVGKDPFGGPLRHLKRAAPPWSSQERTVCGRPLDDVGAWVAFEEAKAIFNKVGQARAQFLFCQNCLAMHQTRAETPTRWDLHPDLVVADWAGRANWRGTQDSERTRTELRALAMLYAAHQEEFDELVAGLEKTERLDSRRRQRR